MSTTRARQLQKLSMQLPADNQAAAQGAEQARVAQLQQTIKQLPGTAGPGTAQQLGAQQQQQSGQIQLQAAQKTGQQQTQLGQQALAGASREQREEGFQGKIALSENQRELANKINTLDKDLKNQLLDKQLQFNTDQAGRQLMNQRQLADWAVLKANDSEEFKNYAQEMQNVYDRKIKMLEVAQRQLQQVLNQGYVKKGQMLDQKTRRELFEYEKAVKKQIADEQAKKAAQGAIITGVFTAAGAVVGGIYGGPMGAAAGASLGGAVGTAAAGATT